MNNLIKNNKWGFLRETKELAAKAGIDKDTGLHRTGMEDYLAVIFPEIQASEWIHDKIIDGLGRRIRPDYRCERLQLIIEFDGLQHYQKPECIKLILKIKSYMKAMAIKWFEFHISFN